MRFSRVAPVLTVAFFSLAAFATDEKIEKDTPKTSPTGTTFTAPAGWTMKTNGNLVVLEAPEGDGRLALIDVDAPDAAAAVAAAWAAYKPDMKRAVEVVVPQSPREGWTDRQLYRYETSPNEKLTVIVGVQRAGAKWNLRITESSDATLDKRGSQFALINASLRPAGYQRESFAGKKAKPLTPERIAILRTFVEDAMRKLDVPGVGLAFIDDGKVVWEGGLGVRELGKPEKVDGHTLFLAASNTKSITTALIATLVDENRLRWDEPVIEAYPTFKLGDAKTTQSVRVRHLLCACTGMPRQDLEWLFEFNKSTPAKSMTLLGTMQPTSNFGELFQYSNLMASAAGYIAGATISPHSELGAAYDDAMKQRIFDPLAMTRTTFDFETALASNHASTHGMTPDGVVRVSSMDFNYAIVPARPAGGVWTSPHDLARYVLMELSLGKTPEGKRVISEQNMLARRAPQVQVGEDLTYGMGLFVNTRYGTPVVSHGGDLSGHHSDMMWLPEHNAGLVIFANSDPGVRIRGPLVRRMLEVLFDGKPEAERDVDASVAQMKEGLKKFRERITIPPDAAEVAKLAGRYFSAELGSVVVMRKGSDVVFDFEEWRSTVATRKNDDGTTSFITIDPGASGFEFVVAEREGKRALVIRDAQHEYVLREAR